MSETPELFDRALQRRRDARAAARGDGHFLLDRVAGELADRAGAITRKFDEALDLSPRAGVLAAALGAAGIGAHWTLAGSLAGSIAGRRADVVADEEWLPFAPARFDLAVAGLGLHRVNDLPGALVQINRALKPDGLLLAALFAGDTLAELRTAFAEAEAEIAGGASPRIAPFADVAELGRLLGRAGFALPVADLDRVTVRYGSPFGLMADLRAMGETNSLVQRSRRALRRSVVMRMAEIYSERFSDADGRVRATFDIVTLTGWHPHASQQQPLRPGSAKARLADALGVGEVSAGERAGTPKPRK